jgi:uncharacterized RDD family membrane protein YckC
MIRYQITTPEQVVFHYRVAGLITRMQAWLLDQVMLLLLRIVIGVVLLFSIAVLSTFGLILLLLAMFALDVGYYTWFEIYRSGQTWGKRWIGIRVVSARGARLRPVDAIVRNLLRVVDSLPPLTMFLGGTIALLDRYHRRLGDLAADTIVIQDIRRKLPKSMSLHQDRVNSFQSDPVLRTRILRRVNRFERDFLLDLAMRREELEPIVRDRIFAESAEYFRRRYDLPEDLDYLSDEQTVLNLALVVQDDTLNFGRLEPEAKSRRPETAPAKAQMRN